MESSINIIYVGDIGDKPVKLIMNDLNKTKTVNMYLNEGHYRVDLIELEKLINAFK